MKKGLVNVMRPTLPWPAHNPDLNSIEHIWDNLKIRIRSRTFPPPTTIPELKDAVLEEWNNIPQAYIKIILDSIPDRLQEVIKARGGNTCYSKNKFEILSADVKMAFM